MTTPVAGYAAITTCVSAEANVTNFAVVYMGQSNSWTDVKTGVQYMRYCFHVTADALQGSNKKPCNPLDSPCCRDVANDPGYKLDALALVIGEGWIRGLRGWQHVGKGLGARFFFETREIQGAVGRSPTLGRLTGMWSGFRALMWVVEESTGWEQWSMLGWVLGGGTAVGV